MTSPAAASAPQPQCSSATPALTAAELQHALDHELSTQWYVEDQKLQRDWAVTASTDSDGKQLSAFLTATRFVEQLARLAEEQQHQFDIHLSQQQLINVTLYDHAAKCISRHDIQLAAAIDALPQPPLGETHRSGQQRKEQELAEQQANGNDNFHPILLDFPTNILTARLEMRSFKPVGDGPMLHKLISASWRPGYMSFNTQPSAELCEAAARTMCARHLDRSKLAFAMFERSAGTFMGIAGLHRMTWDASTIVCDVGYTLGAQYEGRGYATEAANVMARFAHRYFSAANKPLQVQIWVKEDNTGSRKVAERLHCHLERIETYIDAFSPVALCIYSVNPDLLPPLEVEYVHDQ